MNLWVTPLYFHWNKFNVRFCSRSLEFTIKNIHYTRQNTIVLCRFLNFIFFIDLIPYHDSLAVETMGCIDGYRITME